MSSSIVKSTSFEKDNFVCLSCNSGHKLLPRKRNKGQWEGGRKLVVQTDQNFAPVLKMSENNCPVIIRVEGGGCLRLGTPLWPLLVTISLVIMSLRVVLSFWGLCLT